MTSTPSNADKAEASAIPPQKLDPVAGLLSYLIPGLGQIVQGRVAKGVVFFVSLYALFFYGMYLGKFRNVYLPDTSESNNSVSRIFQDLYNRPHFAGQVFIGVAAWPAIWQYMHYEQNKDEGPIFGKWMRSPKIELDHNAGRDGGRAFVSEEINQLQRNESKVFDLGWVYTVIAGVLNILVIYDAVAGPAFREALIKEPEAPKPDNQPTA
jgi:hypothetical protein